MSGEGPAAPVPALEVVDLSYAYARGSRALDRVALTVPEGRFTALLGPNGAGKTTLLALIDRLFEAPGGTIRVHGHDLRRATRAALSAMGVVFQRPTLDLELTVEQNLRYGAALQGIGGAEAARRIDESLAGQGLADRRRAPVRTLSGGLRRRVEIARALLHRPRLLVLDEPTVGLDIESRESIVEHVHGLCREGSLSVLWATHLVDEIRPGDGVVVLAEGRVRASGTLEEIVGLPGAEGSLARAYQRLTGPRLAA